MWVADPKHVRKDNFAEFVANNQDAYKRAAEQRMKEHDALPKEIRLIVYQYGVLSAAREHRSPAALLKYVQYKFSQSALWLTKDGTAITRIVPQPGSHHEQQQVATKLQRTGRTRSTKNATEFFK